MKIYNILAIAILALVLTVTAVRAASVPQVLLSPSQWAALTQQDVLLSVKNTAGDGIVKVELIVPQKSDGTPIYSVEAARPAGWTYNVFERSNGQAYRIVWMTSGTGILANDVVDFGLTAVSPSSGQYQWAWTTTDVTGATNTGTITTGIAMAPLAYFRIDGVQANSLAGNGFRITIRAYGSDDAIKSDYTGTIAITSSDAKGLIPSTYTFSASDKGSKDFTVIYKTAGSQTFTITDWSAKITQKSAVTNVMAGAATSVAVVPQDAEVSPGNAVTFKAMAKDKFSNQFDVTNMTKWSIDKEAGGYWSANSYTAQIEGVWTVVGTYNTLVDGETLTVKSGAVATPTPQPTATPTPTTTPTPTGPVVTPATPTPSEMSIDAQDSLTIAPGSNDTFIVTVNNLGTRDLTAVSLSTTNVPSDWVSIYPSNVSIQAGASKDFLIVVSVPENTSETQNMGILASSNEGITTEKNITVNVGTSPTGLMGLSKNLLNLGIVIVAVAALVLIAWELWFRKSK
jgi:hypothetical protein